MRLLLIAAALVVAVLAHPRATMAQANADAGKVLWSGNTLQCRNCHGAEGEGGFGPDLAGRHLSAEHFRRAVRAPWGIMPAYNEQQLSDQGIAELVAYFDSLPAVATPGPWRVPVPEGAPPGQRLAIATFGCAQCHGPVFDDTRQDAGAAGADFEWFADLVYDHTEASPEERRLSGGNPNNPIRMGNFSRARLPEALLQQIWQYVSEDLGLRVPVAGRLTAGVAGADGTTYTLNVENGGIAGKAATAEFLTVTLTIPAGATVVGATGEGYRGVERDPRSGATVAVWTVPRLAPKERHTSTVTLSAPSPASGPDRLRGTVRWSRPVLGDGSTDTVTINPPPAS